MNAEKLKNLEVALREIGIDCVVAVPMSGWNEFYESFESSGTMYWVSREEEGVALCCGMALGGQKPLLIMQQSGVGNCLNAVFTLAEAYQIYFPILVYDRSVNDINLVQRISSKMTLSIMAPLEAEIINNYGLDSLSNTLKHNHTKKTRWFVLME